jgi:molybdopterin/thiamine biosynthesis adenylyltransferase
VILAGCGAIGSRLADALPEDCDVVFVDRDRVEPENLGVASFGAGDLGLAKADVLAARYRARRGVGRALCGDLRYTLRPGLAAAIDVAVLCLDNASALYDAASSLWAASVVPELVVTVGCGGRDGGSQVRLFVPRGPCPVCLFGEGERRADALGDRTSCAERTAPRASAEAAAEAASAALTLLGRWQLGDRSLANARVQRDGAGPPYVIRMPCEPSPRCPVPHGDAWLATPVEDLGGTVASLSLATVAERALALGGDDAEVLLGRRSVPLAGVHCPACGATAPASPLLLPVALRSCRPCGCDVEPRPLGESPRVAASALLSRELRDLCLAAWGAGHGDELVVSGSRGSVRLRCAFDWSDLDA